MKHRVYLFDKQCVRLHAFCWLINGILDFTQYVL